MQSELNEELTVTETLQCLKNCCPIQIRLQRDCAERLVTEGMAGTNKQGWWTIRMTSQSTPADFSKNTCQ